MKPAIRRLLLALPFLAATPLKAQIAAKADPIAEARNVVVDGNVRLTVLTPQLIRLEWAADGRFEDRASLVFLNRRTPAVQFTKRNERDWLVIGTQVLQLRYRRGSGRFGPENLGIALKIGDRAVTWRP